MKRLFIALLAGILCTALSGCPVFKHGDRIFQYSTLGALSAGVYEGTLPLCTLSQKGDFGIGTFNPLDGEMIFLDGVIYQARVDGTVATPGGATLSPYAIVHKFDADATFTVDAGLDYTALKETLDTHLESRNLFHAFRIDGVFPSIRVRSVPAQVRPFPPLADVVANQQQVFDLTDIEGTMVGYWCPAYIGGFNVAAYHLHFISKDRQHGGHVLEVQTGDATVEMDALHDYRVVLPDTQDFLEADLDPVSKTVL